MKYQSYPEYKDSESEWIDSVPNDWKIAPIKYGYKVVGGSTPRSGESLFWDGNVVWITPADLSTLSTKYLRTSKRTITKEGLESCGTSLVPKGSVIISTRAPIGSLAINVSPLCTNQGCKVMVPFKNGADTRYLYYWLSVNSEPLNVLGRGTTFLEISGDELAGFDMPMPPCPEQQTIANFLDHETAKIDTLIAKQQQLIKLLKEKRQAVISHAVTKGLNPDAQMKDSGIEWLGEVPEHWEFKRARYLFQKEERSPSLHLEIITAYRDGQVCLRSKRRADGYTMAVLEHGYQKIIPGDLVIHGMDAFAGAIGVSEDKGKSTPEYVVLSPMLDGICPEYYAVILRLMALRKFIYVICPSVRERAPRFRFPKLQNVLLPVPPIGEQNDIVAKIKRSSESIDRLLEKVAQQIDLLLERRTTLISAAVTGKIDVRN